MPTPHPLEAPTLLDNQDLISDVFIDLELLAIWLYIKAREWYLCSKWEGKWEKNINIIWDLKSHIWRSHGKHNDSGTSTFFCRCPWCSQAPGGRVWQMKERVHKVLESPAAREEERREETATLAWFCATWAAAEAPQTSRGLLPGRGFRKACSWASAFPLTSCEIPGKVLDLLTFNFFHNEMTSTKSTFLGCWK